jgi:putative transposase
MQENHLIACTRYIEVDSVWAKLVKAPEEWPWSSALAYISGKSNEFVNCRALLDIVKEDWKSFFVKAIDTETIQSFRKHERTGRPIGDNSFIERVEKLMAADKIVQTGA